MGLTQNKIVSRDFIDQKIVNTRDYSLNVTGEKSLKIFPLNYVMVKV